MDLVEELSGDGEIEAAHAKDKKCNCKREN